MKLVAERDGGGDDPIESLPVLSGEPCGEFVDVVHLGPAVEFGPGQVE